MNRENRDLILERFSSHLNEAVSAKYGEKFSGANFANQYNLRATGTTTISRQTALRWLSGKGFPDPGRLYTLTDWLDLHLDEIFRTNKDH
jgi:transcriptional regulator with XRE-family HTH domain